MAEAVTVTGGKSAVEVAYDLMRDIARAEGKWGSTGGWREGVDRKYILDTFDEALRAAMYNR